MIFSSGIMIFIFRRKHWIWINQHFLYPCEIGLLKSIW
jgi:hypothetical protein